MKKLLLSLFFLGFILGPLFSYSFGVVRISLLDITLTLFLIGHLIVPRKNSGTSWQFFLRTIGPFAAVALLSLVLELNRLSFGQIGVSFLYLLRFAFYAAALYIVARDENLQRQSQLFLWASGVSIAILGLFQYFLYPNLRNLSYLGWDPHEFRLFSTLLDPNFTGIILLLTLVLSTYIIQHKNTLWRNFVIVASGLTVLALLLTYSRGSFVAFISVLTVWVIRQRHIKLGLLGLIFFCTAIFLLPRPSGEGINLLRTISIESRLTDNQEALNLFGQSPIIGHGFNTLRFVRNISASAIESGKNAHSGGGFHNGWLTLLTTTGILGLTAFLYMWWKIYSQVQKEKKDLLLLTLTAAFVHSLFDNSLFYPWVMVWMWIVAGSLISLPKASK